MAVSFNFNKEYLINMRGGEKIDSKEYNDVQWEIYYCRSTGFSTVFESAENFLYLNQDIYVLLLEKMGIILYQYVVGKYILIVLWIQSCLKNILNHYLII